MPPHAERTVAPGGAPCRPPRARDLESALAWLAGLPAEDGLAAADVARCWSESLERSTLATCPVDYAAVEVKHRYALEDSFRNYSAGQISEFLESPIIVARAGARTYVLDGQHRFNQAARMGRVCVPALLVPAEWAARRLRHYADDRPLGDSAVPGFGRAYALLTARFGAGTLDALREALGAVRALGARRLLVSPVYPQSTMRVGEMVNDHYYWPAEHGAVAPELGGEPALRRLVCDARRHGVEIVLDVVLNHFGYSEALQVDGRAVAAGDPAWFRGRGDPPQSLYDAIEAERDLPRLRGLQEALTRFSLHSLPTLEHRRGAVRRYLVESHLPFARMGIRAFRVDAGRHMPTAFLGSFMAAMARVAGGETVDFLFEHASLGYGPIRAAHLALSRGLPAAARLFFLDFPLNGALVELQRSPDGFAGFMQFIRARDDDQTPLSALVPFVEHHDAAAPVRDPFHGRVLHLLAEFFSLNPVLLYHGSERAGALAHPRAPLAAVDPAGDVGGLVSALSEHLRPYRASRDFSDTQEYHAGRHVLVVAKRAGPRTLFACVNEGAEPFRGRFALPEPAGELRAHLAGEGEGCRAWLDGGALRVQAAPRSYLVFELLRPPAAVGVRPPAPRVEARLAALERASDEVAEVPRVLMAALEFGMLDGLRDGTGRPVQARAGGLGKVLEELVREYPPFLARHGGEAVFAFMLYGGVDRGGLERLAPLCVSLGGGARVGVYRHRPAPGTDVYFLDHPRFRRRSVLGDGEGEGGCGIYGAGGAPREEAAVLGLFNRAVAALHRRLGCTVYHGHDPQTALVPCHLHPDAVATVSIHNAGAGVSDLRDGGPYAPRAPATAAAGEEELPLPELLAALGLEEAAYRRDFAWKGGFHLLRGATRLLARRNLAGGIAVSPGYAAELRMTRGQVLHAAAAAHGGSGVRDPFAALVPSGGVEFPPLLGIDNGVASGGEAWRHPGLAPAGEEVEGIQDPVVRRAFREDLRFGHDLGSAEGRRKALAARRRLGALLRRECLGPGAPPGPVFAVLSRLVEQKGLAAVAACAGFLVREGCSLVVAGPAGDDAGREVAARLRALQARHPRAVRYLPGFVGGRLRALLQAGADFALIPSQFEPFGLTQVEFSQLGTLVVARRTGGLGKVRSAFYYDWHDPADAAGHAARLRQALTAVLRLHRDDPDALDGMRLDAMAERFPWDDAFDGYRAAYRVIAHYKVLRRLDELARGGRASFRWARERLLRRLDPLPPADLERILRLLREKDDRARTLLERFLLHHFPAPAGEGA